jgi:hypothetical protein
MKRLFVDIFLLFSTLVLPIIKRVPSPLLGMFCPPNLTISCIKVYSIFMLSRMYPHVQSTYVLPSLELPVVWPIQMEETPKNSAKTSSMLRVLNPFRTRWSIAELLDRPDTNLPHKPTHSPTRVRDGSLGSQRSVSE